MTEDYWLREMQEHSAQGRKQPKFSGPDMGGRYFKDNSDMIET